MAIDNGRRHAIQETDGANNSLQSPALLSRITLGSYAAFVSIPWQPHNSAPAPAGGAQPRPNPAAPLVASIGVRIGARFLDLIILMVPLVALDAAVRAVTGRPPTTPAGEQDPLDPLFGVAAVALILGYEWGM